MLLDSLRGGWLARPLLAKLKSMDNDGLLRRTLFIHRNTLEYRLNRISEMTGLNLANFDDRLLLYVALQIDKQA